MLYGLSARELRLGDRLRRRDVQPVAERRVDPERHPVVQPVVDHRGDRAAARAAPRLALDHRGDRQHVVRRQVLRAGVGEVDLPPAAAERRDLLAHELAGRRPAQEVVGRREEEPLEVRLPRPAEARHDGAASRRPGTPPRRGARGRCRSCSAIFATAFTRSAICSRVNPSGKTIRNGFGGGGGGSATSSSSAPASRCGGRPRPEADRERDDDARRRPRRRSGGGGSARSVGGRRAIRGSSRAGARPRGRRPRPRATDVNRSS